MGHLLSPRKASRWNTGPMATLHKAVQRPHGHSPQTTDMHAAHGRHCARTPSQRSPPGSWSPALDTGVRSGTPPGLSTNPTWRPREHKTCPYHGTETLPTPRDHQLLPLATGLPYSAWTLRQGRSPHPPHQLPKPPQGHPGK